MPASRAIAAPPPWPKRSVRSPQPGQRWKLMFSIRPRTGAFTWRNIWMPRRTSASATSCGVVTMMPPVSGTCCVSVSCTSPVPGGRSSTRMSSSPHSTLRRNSVMSFVIIGPRQMTGVASPTNIPIEMTRRPCFSTGMMRRSSRVRARSSMPSMRGTLGPYTSASMRAIAGRSVASASARLVATVDLPTPPLPLATASTLRTPGIGCGPSGRAGAGGGACTISTRPMKSGMASTAARTEATIRSTTSCCAVVGAR